MHYCLNLFFFLFLLSRGAKAPKVSGGGDSRVLLQNRVLIISTLILFMSYIITAWVTNLSWVKRVLCNTGPWNTLFKKGLIYLCVFRGPRCKNTERESTAQKNKENYVRIQQLGLSKELVWTANTEASDPPGRVWWCVGDPASSWSEPPCRSSPGSQHPAGSCQWS